MYTECPNCHTIFRIGPQQLKAANGRVRCGQCATVFDGLASLMDHLPPDVPPDEPMRRPEPAAKFTAADAAALEEFQLSGGKAQDSITRATRAATRPATASAPPPPPPPPPAAPAVEARSRHSEPKTRASAAASFAEAASASYRLEEMANLEGRPHSPWLKFGVLGAIALLLVVLGAGQYFYFKRSVMVAKYPAMRPLLESACAQISVWVPCEITAPRDLKAIRLVQRDVRTHTSKANALMITATFVNEAAFTQAYPVLQLSFSDINGKLIAQRRFLPQEYLTSDIHIEDGLKSNAPVKILLEIIDPGEAAVNFEFSFH